MVLRLGSRVYWQHRGMWGPQALSRSDPEPGLTKSCRARTPTWWAVPRAVLITWGGWSWQRPLGTQDSERRQLLP